MQTTYFKKKNYFGLLIQFFHKFRIYIHFAIPEYNMLVWRLDLLFIFNSVCVDAFRIK